MWFNILYTKSPLVFQESAGHDDLFYTLSPILNKPFYDSVQTENPELDLDIQGREQDIEGGKAYFYDNINIHKELVIGGVTYTFKGFMFGVMSADSKTDKLLGYDIHSMAVTNADEYSDLTINTNLLNLPDDISLANSKTNNNIAAVDSRKTTVQNSDKIAFYGSSFTESNYTIKQKSWTNKVGEYTDWIIGNFGVSGNRIVDIVSRIRDNSNPYASIGIKEFSPSVISISNSGNETVDDMPNIDYYRQELLLAQQAVSEIGAEMLIGTEQVGNTAQEMALYGLSDELGIEVHNNGTVGNLILNQGYPGFWGLSPRNKNQCSQLLRMDEIYRR